MQNLKGLTDAARGIEGLGQGLLRLTDGMIEYYKQEADTQNKLAAQNAQNLYLAINEELENKMAANPADFKSYVEWADKADQRYLDEVRQYTDQMTEPFRKQFNAQMEGVRIKSLSRRQHIAINAKVTEDYNNMQSLLKDAAARGNAEQYKSILDTMLSAAIWQTKGDAWSTLHGGFAIYEYTRQQAKKRGLTDAEAHEVARREWMRSTDETQQSGYLKDLNYYQQNQGLIRYLTVFRSNPIQLLNLEMRTLRELRYGKDKVAAGKKLARQIFVNHLILPTMMLFVTDMMRKGLDVFDEEEMEDYFTAWIFGPFESGTTWLQLAYSLANVLLDRAIRNRPTPQAAAEALPMLKETYQDANGTFKLFEDEVTDEEIMDGLKFAGDVGMLIGTGYEPAGSIGAVVNALATQGKRFIRLFKDEEKK